MPSSVAMTSPPGKPRSGFFGHIFGTLELIKFSHSVFALPFALSAMLVAAHGVPDIWTLLWILWCLVSARTAAMAFNRWADWDYDVFNPRTKRRSAARHAHLDHGPVHHRPGRVSSSAARN